MNRRIQYSRRLFIKSAVSAAVVGPAIVLTACQDRHAVDRRLEFGTLREALAEAERLTQAAPTATDSAWSLPQTLVHCAQSIEYSMTGFPQMKSDLFQITVGAAAFNVFAWRGRMSHDLTEPIPGAPSLENETDTATSLRRLRAAVESFDSATEPLRPHFAYGQLSKSDYELAHAMHLANHFSVIPA